LFVDGSPQKLTSYVVNYLKFMITEYGEKMAEVWKMDNNTSIAEAVIHVMDSLELSLETRIKIITINLSNYKLLVLGM